MAHKSQILKKKGNSESMWRPKNCFSLEGKKEKHYEYKVKKATIRNLHEYKVNSQKSLYPKIQGEKCHTDWKRLPTKGHRTEKKKKFAILRRQRNVKKRCYSYSENISAFDTFRFRILKTKNKKVNMRKYIWTKNQDRKYRKSLIQKYENPTDKYKNYWRTVQLEANTKTK